MHRRHLVALAALAATAAAVPAWAQSNEIRIAHVYSKTGPLEAYGKQTQAGLMMGLEYATGGTMAVNGKSCKPGEAKVTAVAKSGKHPYHLIKTTGSSSTVYGWVNAADIQTGSTSTATSYRVRTTADVLNIRKGPGTNYGVAGQIKGKGIYTIVAEAAGPGATKWGKLKSGAGWISLDYVTKL